MDSVCHLFWAKTSPFGLTHPLYCHLIDVGQVALQIWRHFLHTNAKERISTQLSLVEVEAGNTLAFWASIHDLGKATPAFQRKYQPSIQHLQESGLVFPRPTNDRVFHAAMTTAYGKAPTSALTKTPEAVAHKLLSALGGHHGTWPSPVLLKHYRNSIDHKGDVTWEQGRNQLVSMIAEVFKPSPILRLGVDQTEENELLTWFSGFTSAADWVGSIETYFPFQQVLIPATEYAIQAANQAAFALHELHWTGWQPASQSLRFEQLFPFPPNAIQETIIDITDALKPPFLLIAEATTGAGKTELALYLSDVLIARHGLQGIYVAMPTMATSNQMYERVRSYLASRYPDSPMDPMLIHSQARWLSAPPEVNSSDETQHKDGIPGKVRDQSWFLPRKRSLLAPFGVGTVDQSLLSVLQTRHFFVRLFGLSHKIVIFDEIHAYDTYMVSLFKHLLSWLKTMGTSVVLLSATLPKRTRVELIAAWTDRSLSSESLSQYPSVTWISEETPSMRRLPVGQQRSIQLQMIDQDVQSIVALLQLALANGGCAAVVCNTVNRAQLVYRALETAEIVPKSDLLLFHARTIFGWRDNTEREVRFRFDKKGEGRKPSIIVATQVIEQSLDLDFDIMVSDLAPVDLLLQRAGRLHRHQRSMRPPNLSAPTLYIAQNPANNDELEFGVDERIYHRFMLLRTQRILSGRSSIQIPDDTSELIEYVYPMFSTAADKSGLSEDEREALLDLETKNAKMEQEAFNRLVPAVFDEMLLSKGNDELDEDNPAIHPALQPMTRLAPPSIAVVCLFKTPEGLFTLPDGNGSRVDIGKVPDQSLMVQLARSTISLSHQGIVHQLLKQRPPDAWRKHSLLNSHRLLVFVDSECQIPESPYRLRLTETYGLEIRKEDL